MKQYLPIPLESQDAPDKIRFQKHKGCYVIDYECIATRLQLVYVLKTYSLVEFMDDSGIKVRTVMFWHAIFKDGCLKIVVYDIRNHDIIIKTYDVDKDSNPDWFLYDQDILNQEMNDFMSMFSHQEPKPKESK